MLSERTNLPKLHFTRIAAPGYARRSLAAVCPSAVGLLWWLLASSPAEDKIFGVYYAGPFLLLLIASYVLGWAFYFALSSESFSGIAKNFALTTTTILILAGLIELPALLGVIDYRRFGTPPKPILAGYLKRPWEDPRNVLDSELLYRHRPGMKIAGKTNGDIVYWLGIPNPQLYSVDVQYDSRGFRNDHESANASVVLIGDSFLEGVLVPQSEVISTRLKKLLDVDVANFGTGGYGPQQELVTLQRYGLPLKPRLVLWFFFEGNDLRDVPKYNRYIRTFNKIVIKRETFGQRSMTKNTLLALARLTGSKQHNDGLEAYRRSCKFLPGRGGETQTLYLAFEGAPLSEEELESLETAKKNYSQAQKLTAESGAKIVFVYVPTSFRVYRDFCEFPEDGYAKAWTPNDLPSRLETWCKDSGIPYLDLTPALKESAARGELVYFRDDTHWTPKGHEVAAETIARFLKSRGLDTDLK